MAHTTPHDLMNAHRMEIHMQLDGAHGETVVAHEAETAEQSRLTKTAIWVRIVLHFLDRAVVGAILLLCDNEATVKAVTKEGMSQRTR